jgi:twinkle protein
MIAYCSRRVALKKQGDSLLADAQKGAAVLDASAAAKPRIQSPRAWRDNVRSLWKKGLPPGDRTGWSVLDRHYTVAPGQFSVVTGWPSSGKSEWLDALLVNLSRQGWKFAIFSPENQPVELHIAKILEKLAGKPFGAGPSERLTEEEVDEFSDELEQSFAFVESQSDDALTAKEVIEAAEPYLQKWGEEKRGLIIDPWNELEHWRPVGLTETEYVSKTLSYVRSWARRNKVHVWIVAHPQKMKREDGKLPVPTPDMISGSQHWWNKSDCAITVWRDLARFDSQEVDVYVQKCRFKHIGRSGFVTLHYDRVTGRYHVPPAELAIVK